jgi:hypothetical protein
MVAFSNPTRDSRELPSGGTAYGDECGKCGRRWTPMHYFDGRRRCEPCLTEEHHNAARDGRI